MGDYPVFYAKAHLRPFRHFAHKWRRLTLRHAACGLRHGMAELLTAHTRRKPTHYRDVFFYPLFKVCRRAAQNEEVVRLRSSLRSVVATECQKLARILGGLSAQFTIIQPLLNFIECETISYEQAWRNDTMFPRIAKVSCNISTGYSSNGSNTMVPTGGDWWDCFSLKPRVSQFAASQLLMAGSGPDHCDCFLACFRLFSNPFCILAPLCWQK